MHEEGNAYLSFLTLLGLLFVGLKLGGVLEWSWWWILSPFWGAPAAFIVAAVAAVLVIITTGGKK